jgi:acetyltransferase-like isoleucine patch superfamily enzyme
VIGDWARVEGDAQLEDRARLAAHAVALTGARIGRAAVVGSYAVVDGPVAPAAVIGREPEGGQTLFTLAQTRAPRSSA